MDNIERCFAIVTMTSVLVLVGSLSALGALDRAQVKAPHHSGQTIEKPELALHSLNSLTCRPSPAPPTLAASRPILQSLFLRNASCVDLNPTPTPA
ncbi:exported hypothetical protein [Bradyrhizobium sp. ORS 375]|uniref:hypothetical protein n=1 Tax=Bradyrhizobium sp. (strain ORS 375) TaxID=566679 RepID=UPI000240907D|nr:hypothetical protein [Bradyrhizobium sp. ORS 375]CCD91560.1 exported hypothetical protein [Bradyrhizobium sp. ORS 375]